jgi:hypothetical protein
VDREFPDPVPAKRRKTNHPTSQNSNPIIIDVDVEGESPLEKTIFKASNPSNQRSLRIPPLSGVEESRHVDQITRSPHVAQIKSSQRQQESPSRGKTREQAVMVDDDSQTSAMQASNGEVELGDNLADELRLLKSGKKRSGPQSTGTTSHHFEKPKRPKTKSELVVDSDSDKESGQGSRTMIDVTGRDGRVRKEPDSERLASKFVRDGRVAQSRFKPLNDGNDGDDMTDELGATPETTKMQRKVPNASERRRSKEPDFEIQETPPPEDNVTSSADIKPTSFQTPLEDPVKSKKAPVKQGNKARQDDIYPLESYQDPYNKIGKSQPGLRLRLNDQKNGFSLSHRNLTAIATIELAKIISVQWSPNDCRLVRINGRRDSANQCNLTWDLEFVNHEDLKKFALQLGFVKRIHREPYDDPLL